MNPASAQAARLSRLMTFTTILATGVAGYFGVTLLVIPFAAVALMSDGVIGTAVRLRRVSHSPLSSKALTYLVLGGIGWLFAAWLAYLTGGILRGL